MIQFIKKRGHVHLRILAPTAIRGTHVKAGEIVTVDADDADALLGSERAEIVAAPTETAPAADPADDDKKKKK